MQLGVFLSVILPVSLLVGFRISGVTNGPVAVAETSTLSPTTWECERLGVSINILKTVQSSYVSDASILTQALMGDYLTDSVYGGSDYIDFNLSLTFTATQGILDNVNITFIEESHSVIDFFDISVWPGPSGRLDNLSLTNYADWTQTTGLKAFLSLKGVDNPSKAYFTGSINWIFYDNYTQSHHLEISAATTYYNGSSYKKIIQPFEFNIVADNDSTPENAVRVTSNSTYSGLYLGRYDPEDYYRFFAEADSTVLVNATALTERYPWPKLLVDLYDSNGTWKAGSSKPDFSQSVSLVVGSATDLFVRVSAADLNSGFYSLSITVTQNASKGS
jgi:hypothetical protein